MVDNSNSYLSFLSESYSVDGSMTEELFYSFQNQLWVLLGQRTERYTMGDSSSVPVEVAEELLNSICYCIALCRWKKKTVTDASQGKTINVQELFSLGISEVERQIEIGKKRLNKVKDSMLQVRNDFYQSVTSELALFFKKYDYLFFAHDIPCTIDYPLCHSLEENQGIKYINSYLSCFIIENDFCRHFNTDVICALLETYSHNYESQYINIYELVVNQAIALTLLQNDIFTLDVCETDCNYITEGLLSLQKETAVSQLIYAASTISSQLDIVEPSAIEYLKKSALSLLSRIQTINYQNSSRGVFYSLLQAQKVENEKIQYIDNEIMDDETLRSLIDEIGNCRFLADKITIVEQEIQSLRDLTEVLGSCFWGKECKSLFETFNMTENATLLNFVNKKHELYNSWQSNSNWEVELLSYLDSLEISQKLKIKEIAQKLD